MTKKIILSESAPAAIGPYSQAVAVQGALYVSTHQVLKNLGYILKEAGYDYQDVVKCSIFVKDMNHFAQINQVYAQYFSVNPPARETVEVARLPKDVRVEISCIAHK